MLEKKFGFYAYILNYLLDKNCSNFRQHCTNINTKTTASTIAT